jgi:Domain of Unknown Function (DUF1259)
VTVHVLSLPREMLSQACTFGRVSAQNMSGCVTDARKHRRQRMEVVTTRTLSPIASVLLLGTIAFTAQAVRAQDIAGLDTAGIEAASGLKGQVIAEEKVFKIGKPRTDVKIQVDQWTMPPSMGLGSWAAFTPGHGGAMMMGDTVLFEDEVNPAMSAAFDAGLEVTALHNHFFFDEPSLFHAHWWYRRGQSARGRCEAGLRQGR